MAKFRKKFRDDPHHLDLMKLFPNMVTLAGLCLGISSIRYALADRFEIAVTFIVIAALLDAIDGRLARALNATSKFGGELDSLCDFVNFGLAPIFLIYLWSIKSVPAFGWGAVLFFAICTAIRLARFNSDIDSSLVPQQPKPEWAGKFFTGIPSPAGALMCLSPLMITFVIESRFPELKKNFFFVYEPIFVLVWSVVIAMLMASRLPTYSMKKMFIKRKFISVFLMFFSLLIILAFIEPWLVVLTMGVLYTASLPISALHYIRLNNDKSADA
jgi:CDP-diacylglycerol--serine O-phosphatidyltransferase